MPTGLGPRPTFSCSHPFRTTPHKAASRGVSRLTRQNDIQGAFQSLPRTLEPHRHELGIAPELAVQPVALVAGLALDEHLRGQAALAALEHREMDVRRAARIRHRANGPEGVAAVRVREDGTEALEVRIARVLWLADLVRLPSGVGLPDFHTRARTRLPAAIEDLAGNIQDLSLGSGGAAFDSRQVRIRIAGQPIGIERPLGHARPRRPVPGPRPRPPTP